MLYNYRAEHVLAELKVHPLTPVCFPMPTLVASTCGWQIKTPQLVVVVVFIYSHHQRKWRPSGFTLFVKEMSPQLYAIYFTSGRSLNEGHQCKKQDTPHNGAQCWVYSIKKKSHEKLWPSSTVLSRLHTSTTDVGQMWENVLSRCSLWNLILQHKLSWSWSLCLLLLYAVC